MIPREYVTAFIPVTSLFFMWAVPHNMNHILIRQFQKALDLSRGQVSFIQVSFCFAYVFAALPAGYVMKRPGFKPAILTGYCCTRWGRPCLTWRRSAVTVFSWWRCLSSPPVLASWRPPAVATSPWLAVCL
ncbi:MAG: hypothetical protein R3E50_02760 [Halioglobus sp.]